MIRKLIGFRSVSSPARMIKKEKKTTTRVVQQASHVGRSVVQNPVTSHNKDVTFRYSPLRLCDLREGPAPGTLWSCPKSSSATDFQVFESAEEDSRSKPSFHFRYPMPMRYWIPT